MFNTQTHRQVYIMYTKLKVTNNDSQVTWGPFLGRPGNLTGPKSYFEIKVSRKVERVLTSNEVHFVSLAENFTVQLSNVLILHISLVFSNACRVLSQCNTRLRLLYLLNTSRHFTPHERYKLNKLTSLPMCGFIAQLVEHRTGIAEVMGSNPVEALIFFFQASSFQLLKLENSLR